MALLFTPFSRCLATPIPIMGVLCSLQFRLNVKGPGRLVAVALGDSLHFALDRPSPSLRPLNRPSGALRSTQVEKLSNLSHPSHTTLTAVRV